MRAHTVERGVRIMLKSYDALILEELSYKPKVLVQWLLHLNSYMQSSDDSI